MSKLRIFIIISVILISFAPKTSVADEGSLFSTHFYNSVLLGTMAGFVIGLAVGQGSITTFRITSLGLYGGIVLGLTTGGSSRFEEQQGPSASLSPKVPTYVFSFHY